MQCLNITTIMMVTRHFCNQRIFYCQLFKSKIFSASQIMMVSGFEILLVPDDTLLPDFFFSPIRLISILKK